MAMWTVIIKKLTAGDQVVEDLGITVPGEDQLTFSDQFTHSEIQDSDDLRTLVAAATLVVNDGVGDLSAVDGVKYLRDMNEYEHGTLETTVDDHLDGSANQHDASEIDVETSRTNLGITAPTDLETALGNIDTAVDGKVSISGDTMTGTLDMGANKITSTYVPANDADLVNKLYADSIAAGFDPKESVRFATTSELTTTQAGSGLGATLTNAGTDAAFASDGITSIVGDRVLIKDQDTNKDENGIYTVTTVGVAAEAEIQTIDTTGIDVAGLTQGDFFVINSALDATTYNLWIDIDAAGTGAPSNGNTNVIVSVVTAGTDQDVSDAVVTALNGIAGTPFAADNSTGTTQVVTSTNNTVGDSTDVIDGTAATGFAFANSNQGVTGVDWILTRATDFDGTPTSEVSGGAHTFVEQGTTLEGTGWVVVHDGDVVVDTDDIIFTQVSGQTAITGLQAEVDAIEVSLGTAINGDGTYNGHSGTTYIDASTSYTSALELLDSAVNGISGSISGHLDGGANKHDANEINVENAGTYYTASDAETVVGELDDELVNLDGRIDTLEGLDHVISLDDAYNNGTTITVDNGPVTLTAASGGDAPLQLTPQASLPTTNLADGQLSMSGGILYAYDATRSKWLSVDRKFVAFGRKGNSKDQYLNFYVGSQSSNNSGLRMMRNATIVGLSGQLDASGTCDMNVRKNDVATNIDTLTITAALGAHEIDANIDLTAGDFLQSFISATNNVADPVFIVEIAWRA